MRVFKYAPSDKLLMKYEDLRDDYHSFVRQLKNKSTITEKLRLELSSKYLKGSGIEIGALHKPNYVPKGCRVDYVDQFTASENKKIYTSLSELSFVYPIIIDNGEELLKINNETYDFLIANHMLEHTENLFNTIQNHLRVIKKGGILFYAIPDKRFTFDKDREVTTYEHLVDEYVNGSSDNRIEHFLDICQNISKLPYAEALVKAKEDSLKGLDTHFHVWTPASFFEHIQKAISDSILKVRILDHKESGNWESITILQKI